MMNGVFIQTLNSDTNWT